MEAIEGVKTLLVELINSWERTQVKVAAPVAAVTTTWSSYITKSLIIGAGLLVVFFCFSWVSHR